MRVFSCTHCGHAIFFENVKCLHCGNTLAFLPDLLIMSAIEPAIDNEHQLWHRTDDISGSAWRMCQNSTQQQACNFAVPSDDPNQLCVSCRQTRMAPDLSVPANHEHWVRIEVAKRRLYYTLAKLNLTADHAHELVFEFLADMPGGPQVLTGHQNGVITLNIAEADDAERARRRIELHEPYRTLLGHLRHESGHFFWDRLILQQGRVQEFSELFGDHQLDYRQALADYYGAGGAGPNWQDNHVSGYATAHPWEDWAETWAHYLHMVDLLETASSYSTTLAVPGDGDGTIAVADPFSTGPNPDFDDLVGQWMPVTLLLNSMNRSLGQGDAYPFALTPGALRKLRFVHDVISESAGAASSPADEEKQALDAAAEVVAPPEPQMAAN
ncbi:MAG: putative zinc-binding peptidase [Burkholderiaceae bacterium]|nr:putative zinc-binding peptidase [Burkholderiaceae bacterium]